MEDYVTEELRKPEITDFHKAMLAHVKELVQMSRRHMSGFYKNWDKYDETYRGVRYPDKTDLAARDRKEPEKMVVPVTYAQIQTLVAFFFTVFTQRENMYELLGMNAESQKAAKVGEALLQRDLDNSNFGGKLYQFLLDIGRFGMGVIKHTWIHETQVMKKQVQQQPLTFMGMTLGKGKTVEVEETVTKFQGNKLMSVSPYRFFPDVRLPISRFQEGEFCASEDEYSNVSLKDMEREGLVAGIEYVSAMTARTIEARGGSRLAFSTIMDPIEGRMHANKTKSCMVVTEVQVILIPSEFKVGDQPLGEEDYPIKYVCWYANDSRIIKLEPMGYKHNNFTYSVGEFNPDMHQLVNAGLAETIDQLQSVITWFINSHITSVRKCIQNQMVVDPSGINMTDLSERRPVLRLTPSAARSGVDKWIKQLPITDVTANHMKDAEMIESFVELVTGINANTLGQFHTGRRSAREAGNVQNAVASRLKMLASVIWTSALQPLGRDLLSNLRDGLDQETFVRVMGQTADPVAFNGFVPVNKEALVGNYDFKTFDGTLPSEKGYTAQTLQELLTVLLSNPEAIQLLGYDPRLLAQEILELRGVRNPERFILQPPGVLEQQQMAAMQQAQLPVEQGLHNMVGQPTTPIIRTNGNPNTPTRPPGLNGERNTSAGVGP